ncbi:hypothetical protein LQ772_06650 [Frateuria edaphi]|uniref:hypothetical protein n=1 Tax=Frateuria edaphi TaxID=2898793 RepID=UPI001E60C5EA|nr:hypothetical protein [Frateuria edaphi]UGB46965.1 hypothetical protein LQ772_06650 [Frateuria edaphi]
MSASSHKHAARQPSDTSTIVMYGLGDHAKLYSGFDILEERSSAVFGMYGNATVNAVVGERVSASQETEFTNDPPIALVDRRNAADMSDMNREEVKARLEASEARVATAVESMRADSAALRADLQTGLKTIEAQGSVMRSEAASFFADARRVLAEIQVAQEKDRNQYYALGYKVIVWSFGTVLTVAGLGLGFWNALHKAPPPAQPPAAAQPAAPQPAAPQPAAAQGQAKSATPPK